jgi:hypothetical protein
LVASESPANPVTVTSNPKAVMRSVLIISPVCCEFRLKNADKETVYSIAA